MRRHIISGIIDVHFLYVLHCIILSLAIVFSSCDNKENKEIEPADFVRIFDNNSFSDSFEPVSIKQTEDEGFLILGGARIAESQFLGVYVLKTDKEGNFITHQQLGSEYVNPVGNIIKSGSGYYFFCMNRVTLETVLFRVDGAGVINEISSVSAIYPLAAAADRNERDFLLLSYDREEKNMVVSKISMEGKLLEKQVFDVGFGDFDPEDAIIDHLTGVSQSLPFFCGALPDGRYYYNGYYMYSLSLVFFDFGREKNTGVINGYQNERPVVDLVGYGTGHAIAKKEFGAYYFLPKIQLNTSKGASSSSTDLEGYSMAELGADTKVVITTGTAGGKVLTVYAAHTRSKQIVLYFYNQADGALVGTKYLGYTNPYHLKSVTFTARNGLAIAGTTWVAGRFSRICLFIISEGELKSIWEGE